MRPHIGDRGVARRIGDRGVTRRIGDRGVTLRIGDRGVTLRIGDRGVTRPIRALAGSTLVELLVAAPIALGALGLGLVLSLGWMGRVAAAAADPVLGAMPVLEALRRDVREASEVVYPRPGDTDLFADALVLRARDGTFVGWRVHDAALERTAIGSQRPSVRMRGVERIAVRRLGAKKPLVRVGLLRTGRGIVLLSAAPLAAGTS